MRLFRDPQPNERRKTLLKHTDWPDEASVRRMLARAPQVQWPTGFLDPVDPEHMPAHADRMAVAMQRNLDLRMDFTPASLPAVDAVLGSLPRPRTRQEHETQFFFGAYVGEVLTRTSGHRWVDAPDAVSEMLGFPLVLLSPSDIYSNPIGRTFDRVRNGGADSVSAFVRREMKARKRMHASG